MGNPVHSRPGSIASPAIACLTAPMAPDPSTRLPNRPTESHRPGPRLSSPACCPADPAPAPLPRTAIGAPNDNQRPPPAPFIGIERGPSRPTALTPCPNPKAAPHRWIRAYRGLDGRRSRRRVVLPCLRTVGRVHHHRDVPRYVRRRGLPARQGARVHHQGRRTIVPAASCPSRASPVGPDPTPIVAPCGGRLAHSPATPSSCGLPPSETPNAALWRFWKVVLRGCGRDSCLRGPGGVARP